MREFFDFRFLHSTRTRVLACAGVLVAVIALVDWHFQENISFGFLYLFPMLMVGGSRIYLGAHWFTDVVGGYALAGAWVALLTAVGLTTTLVRRHGTGRIRTCGG